MGLTRFDGQTRYGACPVLKVHMPRRERRRFAPEYKAEVVALVRSSGKSVGQVARDLDLTETAVREWVQRAEIEEGTRPRLTAAEREELVRLRRQVRFLEEERAILKRAGFLRQRDSNRTPRMGTTPTICGRRRARQPACTPPSTLPPWGA